MEIDSTKLMDNATHLHFFLREECLLLFFRVDSKYYAVALINGILVSNSLMDDDENFFEVSVESSQSPGPSDFGGDVPMTKGTIKNLQVFGMYQLIQ